MRFTPFVKWFLCFSVLWSILNCSGSNEESPNTASDGYSDGPYCAKVEYYYAKTGTSSTYTLLIDVEDGNLMKIHWPNGGWLDNSHFTPPDITNGSTRFTSNDDVNYTVTILGQEGECSLSTYVENEDDLIKAGEEQDEEEEQEQRIQQEEEYNEQRRQREEEGEQERKRQEEEERSSSEETPYYDA